MSCVAPTVDGSHTQLPISTAVCFYLLIYFNQHFFCDFDFSNRGGWGWGGVHASSILLLLKASSHFHPFPPSPTLDSSLYHCSHKSHNAPVIITPTPVYLKPVAWRGASLSLSLFLSVCLSLFPPPLPCCSFSHYLSFFVLFISYIKLLLSPILSSCFSLIACLPLISSLCFRSCWYETQYWLVTVVSSLKASVFKMTSCSKCDKGQILVVHSCLAKGLHSRQCEGQK